MGRTGHKTRNKSLIQRQAGMETPISTPQTLISEDDSQTSFESVK